jgi:pilus assembly protein CpaB
MWKVKRMNTARIVVLAIAVCAGGAAAYLASGSDTKPVVAERPTLETTDVLIAKTDIGLGQTVTADDIKWQSWPAETSSASFVRRNDQPEAMTQIVGSIARSPFIAGEPIRETKLVKATGSGFMAAILPTGMRAISTEISPETGAGGFILPNDKVDVILTKRDNNSERGGKELISSATILTNVRVLAVDQTIGEKDGQKVVVGKTATLELKPEQAESLARARQSGTLSLSLRSLSDANNNQDVASDDSKRDSVNIVRYGVSTTATTRK